MALFAAKLAFGLAVLAILLYRADWRTVLAEILDARVSLLLASWIFGFAGLFCYALMHHMAMRPLNMPLSTGHVLRILFQIRFYGLFLPGGANALVKWRKFSRPGGQPAQAFALMSFGQVLHAFSSLLLAVIGLNLDPRFPWPGLAWLTAGFFVLSTVLLLLLVSESAGSRFFRMFQSLRPDESSPSLMKRGLARLLGAAVEFRRSTWLEVTGYTAVGVAGKVFESIQLMLVAHAVGIGLPFETFIWMFGVVMLCTVVPVTAAGLGVREAALVSILVAYGVPEGRALTFSLVYYGAVILVRGLIGGLLEFQDWMWPGRHGETTRG